jgi:hypothetical protein
VKSIVLVVIALTAACAKKETGARTATTDSPATPTAESTGEAAPVASGTTTVARTTGAGATAAPSSWYCFTLGRHAADTQCESSEADCKSLLDVAREAAPQAAARTSCTANPGPVFCFEETEDSGSARLCSNTRQGCDDARKGALADQAKRATGSKIGACAETR